MDHITHQRVRVRLCLHLDLVEVVFTLFTSGHLITFSSQCNLQILKIEMKSSEIIHFSQQENIFFDETKFHVDQV